MTDELRAQLGYMREAGNFNPSARRGEPGNMEDFCELSDLARRQVVWSNATRGLAKIRESSPGVPWKVEDMDWAEAALLHLEQGGARTLDDYAPLREAGIPFTEPGNPEPLGQDDPDMLAAMAECEVPLHGSTPQPRRLTPLAALVDRGVPLREGGDMEAAMRDAGVSSRGAKARETEKPTITISTPEGPREHWTPEAALRYCGVPLKED